jgi:sugar phosphate isomerase/epimerase
LRLTCQEHLAPGETLAEKWEFLHGCGFDGIELRGFDEFAFAARRDELAEAHAAGVPMPTVCVISDHFIGDFDRDQRLDAIAQMRSLLTGIAQVGGEGAITPASFGMHSNALPPFSAPRTPEEDRAVLLEALGELGDHAAREGVQVYLEPLNRYEDHMLNTLAQATDLCTELGHASVRVMGDLFHMSIEEVDLPAALGSSAEFLAHVHLADSNRHFPGAGHTSFPEILTALREIDYSGCLALECRVPDPERTLPRVARLLRDLS